MVFLKIFKLYVKRILGVKIMEFFETYRKYAVFIDRSTFEIKLYIFMGLLIVFDI